MSDPRVVTATLGNRLRRFNPLNKTTLLLQFMFLSATMAGYEVGQAENPAELLYVGPIAGAVFFGLMVLIQFPLSKLAPSVLRAALVALGTVISYLGKSAVLLLLLYQSTWLQLLQARLPGDVTVALTFYWLSLGILATSVSDLKRAEDLVANTRGELETQRLIRVRTARDFENQLRGKIEAALVSELSTLAETIKGAKTKADAAKLADTIHSLVETKVRPLAHSLSNSAERLNIETPLRPIRKKSVAPPIVPIRDTKPWLLFFIAVPNLFATAWQNSTILIATYVTVAAVGIPILNFVVASLMGNRKLQPAIYLPLLMLQTVVGYVPASLVILNYAAQYPNLAVLRITGIGVLAGVSLVGAFWSAYFFAQKEQIDLAEDLNQDLKHELSLIDQAIWVAKRRWSYIVHGTIQSALTVAAARLTSGSSTEDAIAAIRVALTSIQTPAEKPGDVVMMLESIRRTWLGVCDLSWELSPKALERLNTTPTGATCLIEIVKELVSNAHRHGAASKIWISVYPSVDDDLQIIAGNNGRQMNAAAVAGMGMQLFHELTKDFDFEKMKLGGFQATIALPR